MHLNELFCLNYFHHLTNQVERFIVEELSCLHFTKENSEQAVGASLGQSAAALRASQNPAPWGK